MLEPGRCFLISIWHCFPFYMSNWMISQREYLGEKSFSKMWFVSTGSCLIASGLGLIRCGLLWLVLRSVCLHLRISFSVVFGVILLWALWDHHKASVRCRWGLAKTFSLYSRTVFSSGDAPLEFCLFEAHKNRKVDKRRTRARQEKVKKSAKRINQRWKVSFELEGNYKKVRTRKPL